jgi:CheY-like chemotaxis protein
MNKPLADALLAGRRVLVVEDEMLILMMTEDLLADLGCTSVVAAATVDRALALIGANDFDLAVLDMNLSGDRTDAVADAFAAKGVPFVFATGYAGHMWEGYDDRPVLTKPYQPHQLVAILRDLLALDPAVAG